MPSQSDKFEPTFIPLSDVIYEVARRVPVSDEDAEIRGGLSRSSDPLIAQLDLAPIKDSLGRARAAPSQISKLNKRPLRRPHWVDASSGYPLLDDSASMDGLKILVAMERYESESLPRGGINRFKVSDRVNKENKRLAFRSKLIGFMRSDLPKLLDNPTSELKASSEGMNYLDGDLSRPDDGSEVSGVEAEVNSSSMKIEQARVINAQLDDAEYLKRISSIIMSSRKILYDHELVEALRRSVAPRDYSRVWRELVRMAKDGESSFLEWVSETQIKVAGTKSVMKPYGESALRQRLRKADIELALQLIKNK